MCSSVTVLSLSQGQLVGQSIEKFVYPDDLCAFQERIKPRKREGSGKGGSHSDNGELSDVYNFVT